VSGGDLGFEYTVALTQAIQASAAAVERTNPEAFRYRGAHLRGAVERALYINLASHEQLMRAYADPSAPPPELGSWIANRTGAALLEREPAGARLDARAFAARGLFAARATADRVTGRARDTASTDGPACFVLDHPKYLRFIAPIRERMDVKSAVLATHGGDGVDEQVDAWDGDGEPEGRAVGRALWGFPTLLRGFDRVLRALSARHASRAVVVEGMSPLDEITSQAARSLGIRSICLQQGWSPLVHAGFRGMTQSQMAVWGEGFRELLEPHNPGVEFAVTGNPVLGAEMTSGRLEEELGGRRCVAFFLQSQSAWIGPEHLRALHELVARTAAELPDVAVLVREHPGAPLRGDELELIGSAPNLRMVPAADWPLREVLEAADVAVSIYSTSLLEGAALGTPAVIFNPTSLPALEPDLVRLGAATRAATVDRGLEQIAAAVADPDARAALLEGAAAVRDRYFAGGDASGAAARVAELIDGERK
jgi:hypothetical protein